MTVPPKRRWFAFSLRTMFMVVTVACVWLGYNLNWIRQRHKALDWLEASPESWYSPYAGPKSKLQARAPWSLRMFGERGIVGIGMDRQDFAGPSPYSPATLKELFPEARVDYSREGRFEDDQRP